jgi:molybdenum cofactor biosynthesis protein B
MGNRISSSTQHRKIAQEKGAVSLALVTVSDTRTKDTDANATFLKKQIEKASHKVVSYDLIKDEAPQVEAVLEKLMSGNAQVIIFNGGTGIAPRDRTYDVLAKKIEKVLPGFGEIFRVLSYDQVGAAAMLSRAVAGVYKNKVIISIPGSPQAVELAWQKLIKSELQHLAWEITR